VHLDHSVQQDLVDRQGCQDRMELQALLGQVVLLEAQVRAVPQVQQVLLVLLEDRVHKVPLALLGLRELREHPVLVV